MWPNLARQLIPRDGENINLRTLLWVIEFMLPYLSIYFLKI